MIVNVLEQKIDVHTTPTKIDIFNQSSGKAVTLIFQDDDGKILMYLSHEQIKFIAENCKNLPEPGKGIKFNCTIHQY